MGYAYGSLEPAPVQGRSRPGYSYGPASDAVEEEPEGAREATIMLDDAVPLADAVKAGTKGMTIRLPAATTDIAHLEKMRDVLSAWKGSCPVTLQLTMVDGAEAVLALAKEYRVEVGDPLLAGLERVFGEQVAELR